MNIFQHIRRFLFGTEYVLLINSRYSYCLPVKYAGSEVFVRETGSHHTTLLPGGKTNDYQRWQPFTPKARSYYNAIVPQCAAQVIGAYMEIGQ